MRPAGKFQQGVEVRGAKPPLKRKGVRWLVEVRKEARVNRAGTPEAGAVAPGRAMENQVIAMLPTDKPNLHGGNAISTTADNQEAYVGNNAAKERAKAKASLRASAGQSGNQCLSLGPRLGDGVGLLLAGQA
jgi:hypothetical protein